MINIRILTNIWLSEVEAKIYLCLLEKWAQNITSISKTSLCNRVQIYTAIPRLKEKQLISESLNGKRKVFFAENPENLENIFYEQKLSFQNTVSLLKQTYEKKNSTPQLKVFYTRESIKHIFDDIITTLNPWDTYYRYSSRKQDHLRWFLGEIYKKKRDSKEIQRMVITSDELLRVKEVHKKINREMVAIPKKYDLFEDNITKVIYGNKVAILDYNSDTSFVIENQKFADFEKKIFKLLFKYLRRN